MTETDSQLGPYRLGTLLKETPVSRIHAAEHVAGAQPGPLCCKVYSAVSDAFARELAERARAVMGLQCPHLVGVVDVGRVGGQLIVVRLRTRSLTLAEVVERARASRRQVSHGAAVMIAADILAGLAVAHAHKALAGGVAWLSHGEVGPEHILVDEAGQVALLGLETPRGTVPEKPPGAKFDLAGASATLYDLLSPKKTAEGGPVPPRIPAEFAALLTSALGLGGMKGETAAHLRERMMETARSAAIPLATPAEVGSLVKRLLEVPASPTVGLGASCAPATAVVLPEGGAGRLRGSTPPAGTAAPVLAPPPPPLGSRPPSTPPRGEPSRSVSREVPAASPGAVPRPVSGIFAVPKERRQPRLGETLLAMGAINQAQLDGALARQKDTGGRLGEILQQDQSISDGQLADALAQLSGFERAWDADVAAARPSALLAAAVPASLALDKRVVPLSLDAPGGCLTLAVADPFDAHAVRQVQLLVGAQSVMVRVAKKSAVEQAASTLQAMTAPESRPRPAPAAPGDGPAVSAERRGGAVVEEVLPAKVWDYASRFGGSRPPGPSSPPPRPSAEPEPAASSGFVGRHVSTHVRDPGMVSPRPAESGRSSSGVNLPVVAAPAVALSSRDVDLPLISGQALAAKPPLPARAPAPGSPESLAGLLVLVCEPDGQQAVALTQRLVADDWRVVVVGDGVQARAALEREMPAAIVSEMELARVDGLGLLVSVRSKEATRELPFFMVSSEVNAHLAPRALELGADDFLPRPLNVDLMVTKLRRAVARHQAMEHQKRAAVAQRRAAEEQKRVAEEQKRVAEEQKKVAEEQKLRAQAEIREAEERKRQAEEEKRAADEQRRAAAEQKRAAEAQRREAEAQRREAEAQRREAEERLRAAQEEQKKAPARVPQSSEMTGVLGSLRQMGLVDVVQSLEMGRKTAVITLAFSTGETGQVVCMEGEVVDALLGDLVGVDAFYEMARPREGSFRISYNVPPDPPNTVGVSTSFLLLEAMRRQDEAGVTK
jgi:DNA-binding response OmpR family regulator